MGFKELTTVSNFTGDACFVCETDQNLGDIGSMTTSDCPRCSPTVVLDLLQGQRVLEHIGSHILYDPAVIQSIEPLCSLCLCPSQLCRFYLAKGKGAKGNLRINPKGIEWLFGQDELLLRHSSRINGLFALLQCAYSLPRLPKG
jgi:hypothetical protein